MEYELHAQMLAAIADLKAALNDNDSVRNLLIGGVIGLVAALIPSFLMELYRGSRERDALRASIVSEIAALAEIARARQYIGGLAAGASGNQQKLQVKFPDDYFLIYKSNASRIGRLSAHDATRIVRFYQLAESVIQDVTPGGILYNGSGGPAAFKEAQDLLEQALAIAEELKSGR